MSARILPPGYEPSDEEFQDALATARTGWIQSEWLFTNAVLDALDEVAAEPSDVHIAAARAAWAVSGGERSAPGRADASPGADSRSRP